jgi:hypothetical protein
MVPKLATKRYPVTANDIDKNIIETSEASHFKYIHRFRH